MEYSQRIIDLVSMNGGIGNAAIKRILNEREHVKNGEGKTIIVPHALL